MNISHTDTFKRFFVCLALCSATIFSASTAHSATADDLKEATKLYQENKLDQALTKVNAILSTQPKDAQGRFLKGIIFTEQRKTAEAIQVFTGLTEDYPELPEPYNNLAVLYASQGNYDKAKAALELAIHTHPTYATAHENLGDIYAQLARRAYDKALQLDKNNTAALTKLSLVKNLFSSPANNPANQALPPVTTAKADPAKVAATVPPATTPTPGNNVSKPITTTVATVKPGSNNAGQAATSVDDTAQLKTMVEAWASAWSAKDVPGYLAFYAPNFETPDGLSRTAWNQQRKERIEKPKKITVEVSINTVSVNGDQATIVIKQKYRSDSVKSDGLKTIKAAKVGGKWMIASERVN